MSLHNEMLYGSAANAADTLGALNEPQEFILPALINALVRVSRLEESMKKLQEKTNEQ